MLTVNYTAFFYCNLIWNQTMTSIRVDLLVIGSPNSYLLKTLQLDITLSKYYAKDHLHVKIK